MTTAHERAGKALLSVLPAADFERAIGKRTSLERLTTNTICDHQALLEELKRTRRRGYAVDREETALGLKCVAVCVDLHQLGSAAINPYRRSGLQREFCQCLIKSSRVPLTV